MRRKKRQLEIEQQYQKDLQSYLPQNLRTSIYDLDTRTYWDVDTGQRIYKTIISQGGMQKN